MGGVRWAQESSSSMKLLLFMVPLVLVAGLVFILGPNPSSWVSFANAPVLLGGSVITSSSSTSSGAVTVTDPSEAKQREGLVVVAVENRGGEKAISDDTDFNHSSTPPFSVQAIQTPQQPVRLFYSIIIIAIIQSLSL